MTQYLCNMRSALARSRYYIIAKGNNADSLAHITSWTYYKHTVGEQRKALSRPWVTTRGQVKRWNEFELYPWQRATLWDKTKSCHVGPECMLGSLPLHIRLSPFAHSLPVLRERRKGTRVCPAFLKVTLLPIISLQVRGHYRWAVNFHSPSQISLRNGVNCIFVLERKINKRSLCQIFFGRSQARGFCLSRLGGLRRD